MHCKSMEDLGLHCTHPFHDICTKAGLQSWLRSEVCECVASWVTTFGDLGLSRITGTGWGLGQRVTGTGCTITSDKVGGCQRYVRRSTSLRRKGYQGCGQWEALRRQDGP
uniref:Uncharacterized protein n=1 Tax=Eutreptiella gymnastica TaxID=73025 RepID=A0A7S4FT45_9EUGL